MLSTVKFVMKAEAELTKIILLGADFFIKSVFKEKSVVMYEILYAGCQLLFKHHRAIFCLDLKKGVKLEKQFRQILDKN